MASLRPGRPEDVVDAIADAAREGTALEIIGGGTKALIGAPRGCRALAMDGFDAVIDYDPAELVLTVGAGARLSVIEALLAAHGQRLAFDPVDYGPLFGRAAGGSTIGGILAAAVSGPGRLSRGAARDHFLGFKAVSGRGEVFVGGAKVVKNVTGYDLPKALCGSWGRLAALVEATLKVLPAPETETTLALEGLTAAEAVAAMGRALASTAGVAAAAFVPGGQDLGVVYLKLDGFGPSVHARRTIAREALGRPCADELDPRAAAAVWTAIRDVRALADAKTLWRVTLAPSRAAVFLADPCIKDRPLILDWGGGLVWLDYDGPAGALRGLAEAAGGGASLIRADEVERRATPALHPLAPGVAALEARLRRAFDPRGVFATGRFAESAHED